MRTFFWTFLVFLYFLIGGIIYMQGYIPELVSKNDIFTILRILFLWPTYMIG